MEQVEVTPAPETGEQAPSDQLTETLAETATTVHDTPETSVPAEQFSEETNF